MRRALSAMAIVLLPAAAEACATCIASPYGDRTYNWPYLFLILLPFVMAAVIGGVMARVSGVGIGTVRRLLARLVHPAHKETT